MSDNNSSNDKTMTLSKGNTLSLKGKLSTTGLAGSSNAANEADQSQAKPRKRGGVASPSGPKTVVVKKRSRLSKPLSSTTSPVQGGGGSVAATSPKAPLSTGENKAKRTLSQNSGGTSLTSEEEKARNEALARAMSQAEEDKKRAQEIAERRAREDEERAKAAKEREEQEKQKQEEESQKAEDASNVETVKEEDVDLSISEPVKIARPKPQKKTEPEQRELTAEERADLSRGSAEALVEKTSRSKIDEKVDSPLKEKKREVAEPSKPSRTRGEDNRRRTKLTVMNALDEDERERSLASMRRRRERNKRQGKAEPREKISREVILPEAITIQEFANRMSERAVDVVKLLMQQGQMMKATDSIDADTAELIAQEMGHSVKRVSDSDVVEGIFDFVDDEGDKLPRPPVVTIMGHVDHGKTSLLDALREANVVSGEAGGITQHIGAYQVELDGQPITFIDTPGHAAFTAMRSRGAKATDIVVLVVSADDSVMPQTIEAINHAKAAEVPLIIAVNKIDKPDADPDRVITDLLQHEIVTESMGGDVLEVRVSALKRMNLDKLLEAILLQSELLDLKANPDRAAQGLVIEAKLDKGRGPVATVLVQHGTLKQGDIVVAGAQWAKVRALIDDQSNQVKQATPSVPVEILGFDGTPEAGDPFVVVENEARAREITEYRERQARENALIRGGSSLEQMMMQLKAADRRELTLIVKADVQGSLEAIVAALSKAGNEEVEARIVHAAVGGITETDITLAATTGASIMAFNVRANNQARDAAERSNIEIRYYSVIYDLIDDVKSAMSGLLDPEVREEFIGYAEILEVFNVSKVGKVAGCLVTEGLVERGNAVRLLRDNTVIHQGQLSTLKRFKDEVKEVRAGQECGMAFENYQDMRKGDMIECFRVTEHARKLD